MKIIFAILVITLLVIVLIGMIIPMSIMMWRDVIKNKY